MIALGRVWKLYLVYTILLVVGLALAGFLLEAQVKKSLTEHLEEDALTLAKVIARRLRLRVVPQQVVEPLRGGGHGLAQPLVRFDGLLRRFAPGQLDAGPRGEQFERLAEFQPVAFHHEREHVAARVARAEATRGPVRLFGL